MLPEPQNGDIILSIPFSLTWLHPMCKQLNRALNTTKNTCIVLYLLAFINNIIITVATRLKLDE